MNFPLPLRLFVCALLTICAQPYNALAWGNDAHRIMALMAQEMLTPRARIAAADLLDGGTLADASTYMDLYREALKRELPGADTWHFDNRPICGKLATDFCADGNCLSVQVPRLFGVLADQNKAKSERQQALRFLIHLVADIHQPLHASDDNDAGGNRKLVLMPGGKFPINLHLAWDVELPKIAMRGLTEQQVAKDLLANHKRKFADWMKGDVELWVAHSYGIGKRLAYGKLPGFSCGEIDGIATGLRNGKAWNDDVMTLPREYVEGAIGIIPLLLAQAGARIGGLLNAALDPEGSKAVPTTAAPVIPSAPKPAEPPTTSLQDALSRKATPPAAPQ